MPPSASSLARAHLFHSAVNFIPIHVLHERVYVFGCRCAVVHMVGMLVHVEHEKRITHRRIVHVIPGPVVVNFAGVQVEGKNRPT